MNASRLSFFAPAAVLSAWGTVMLHTAAGGHLNRLLSPLFHGCVVTAGVLLIVLSIAYLFLYQPAENPAPALAPAGRVRQLLRWAVLLVPVLAACVLSPDALSNTTLANRANLGTAGAIPMPSLSAATADEIKAAQAADPNQPAPVEVTDLITLSHQPAQMKNFAGRTVRTVGLLANDGSSTKLVRWIMWCCAADAQPVSVTISGGNIPPGPYKDDAWYEITGTAQFPSTLGQVVPRIDVTSVKPAQEPDEPYLSP
jgi:uncharacterized repeat protein (TIGR03943 family)